MALKDGKAQCKMMLAVLDSPMGRIEISGCETGIHELSLQKDAMPPNGTKEASITCELCEGPEEMTEPLKQCTAWLSAYFCEPWVTEKLPIPSFHHPIFEQASFTRQVLWTLLRDVKFGETVSYKQLADLAGNSKAARAVGGAMRSNPEKFWSLGKGSLLSSSYVSPQTKEDHLERDSSSVSMAHSFLFLSADTAKSDICDSSFCDLLHWELA
ncbi:PREDICTED: methylated-DNA--protein-cysteine methyltransferase isoform X1 [Crocodylus porosus]|uniref:methylated-DNA--protein-cysteine methyltransferase isoform X1 n=1 Tax=Crocodylus porosus TaxID=8502 RepID=UPI000939B4BD|nr:PREDICTED: methylated-DNA--protein-cysteine methyltransferase isoform X1 [Crocodylus porosus]XP_019411693.1 PREDICTED: methylated-DNA--protein-cysteine methyltransferase isoform X1 [Crocodylus porosus]XP_019411694.1 PREDICTED: methylated-DNA--protein-cysteine methyltransferase isoform X1 [Crocodylus porosus]